MAKPSSPCCKITACLVTTPQDLIQPINKFFAVSPHPNSTKFLPKCGLHLIYTIGITVFWPGQKQIWLEDFNVSKSSNIAKSVTGNWHAWSPVQGWKSWMFPKPCPNLVIALTFFALFPSSSSLLFSHFHFLIPISIPLNPFHSFSLFPLHTSYEQDMTAFDSKYYSCTCNSMTENEELNPCWPGHLPRTL